MKALTRFCTGVSRVVSGINSSSYCIAAHLELLRRLGVEKALGKKLAVNYPSAPVPDKDMALFQFADKLTRHPDEIEKSDAGAVCSRPAGMKRRWSKQSSP